MLISVGDTFFNRSYGYSCFQQNNPWLGGQTSEQTGQPYANDPVQLSLSPAAEKFRDGTANPSQTADDQEKTGIFLHKNGKEQAKDGHSPKNERLTEAEQKMVDELQKRDLEVRAHEAAHASAAGAYAIGGANFEYQQGPDGKSYAIGGHVKLDMKPESTPEATIAKMQTIRRAALAPADPSSTDRSVAAAAAKIEMQARRELNEKLSENSSAAHRSVRNRSGASKPIARMNGLYGSVGQLSHPGRNLDQTI